MRGRGDFRGFLSGSAGARRSTGRRGCSLMPVERDLLSVQRRECRTALYFNVIAPMLRCFPVAYEDELLYSLIARYHIHTCSPSFKQTIEDLFGSKNFVAVVDLPPHLERLHQYTSHITRQNVTDILLRHTLYPLFAPFLGPEPAARVRASMLSDYGGDVHTRAGIVASRLKRPGVLRVCPVCHQEQVRRNAEAYWQRLFQVTGALSANMTETPGPL